MAYSNSTSDRMDELRFRSQQSLDSINGLVSPPRTSRVPQSQPLHTQDGRGGLMRRFTTDSGRVPTIGSLLTQRGVPEQAVEYGPSVCNLHRTQIPSNFPEPSTPILAFHLRILYYTFADHNFRLTTKCNL